MSLYTDNGISASVLEALSVQGPTNLYFIVSSQHDNMYPLVIYSNSLLLKMTIEIVDFPIKNGGSFHSYVNVYQRVSPWCSYYCANTASTSMPKVFRDDCWNPHYW